jgi:hypothetical protein
MEIARDLSNGPNKAVSPRIIVVKDGYPASTSMDNTCMLFGDANATMKVVLTALKE